MIPVSRVMDGLSRASIEIWALNGLVSSGDLKLGSDDNPHSVWFDLIRSGPVKISSGGLLPVPVIPDAGAGEPMPSTTT
jgi:hypothetical protein